MIGARRSHFPLPLTRKPSHRDRRALHRGIMLNNDETIHYVWREGTVNQKSLGLIAKIRDTLSEVVDALDMLHDAITDESDERVDQALDMFPTPKALTKALESLGSLIEGHPWERKKRNAG